MPKKPMTITIDETDKTKFHIDSQYGILDCNVDTKNTLCVYSPDFTINRVNCTMRLYLKWGIETGITYEKSAYESYYVRRKDNHEIYGNFDVKERIGNEIINAVSQYMKQNPDVWIYGEIKNLEEINAKLKEELTELHDKNVKLTDEYLKNLNYITDYKNSLNPK